MLHNCSTVLCHQSQLHWTVVVLRDYSSRHPHCVHPPGGLSHTGAPGAYLQHPWHPCQGTEVARRCHMIWHQRPLHLLPLWSLLPFGAMIPAAESRVGYKTTTGCCWSSIPPGHRCGSSSRGEVGRNRLKMKWHVFGSGGCIDENRGLFFINRFLMQRQFFQKLLGSLNPCSILNYICLDTSVHFSVLPS